MLIHVHDSNSHTLIVFEVKWTLVWICVWLLHSCWPFNVSLVCAFIHACRRSVHRLVVCEKDSTVSNAILSTLINTIPTYSLCGSMAHNTSVASDEGHVKKVAIKMNRVCKFTIYPYYTSVAWEVHKWGLIFMILFYI